MADTKKGEEAMKEKGKLKKIGRKIGSGLKLAWTKTKVPLTFVAGAATTFVMNLLFGTKLPPMSPALPDKSKETIIDVPVAAPTEETK